MGLGDGNEMKSLDDLLIEYGSDKGMHETQGARYGKYYERHLNPIPHRLLEVGVATGASLRAWSDWGVQEVVGVDIHAPEIGRAHV